MDTSNKHFAARPPGISGSMTLSCGLLAIPVATGTGTESQTDIVRKGWRIVPPSGEGDGGGGPDVWHEVGSQSYDKVTGEVLTKDDIVYCAEADNGVWVPLSDADKDEVLGGTADDRVAEVVAFVPKDSLLREYVVIKWDQCRPALRKVGRKRDPDPAAERAFGLLMEAMRSTDTVALVKLNRRWHALTPDGWFLRLAYASTVRAPAEMPKSELKESELRMAVALVEALSAPPDDLPVLEDEAGPKLAEYVNAKAAGLEVPAEVKAPVVHMDLAAAIEATIEAARARKAG